LNFLEKKTWLKCCWKCAAWSMCWLGWCLVMFVDLPSCNTLFYSGLFCTYCFIMYGSH